LLLKVASSARTPVTLYGQEKDAATSGLARMNMILHGNPTATIWQGNTIADPKLTEGDQLKQFDFVVANPPFSDKRWSTGLEPTKYYGRFDGFGMPLTSRATTPTYCTSCARSRAQAEVAASFRTAFCSAAMPRLKYGRT
jgi:type I restriction-modification system DNA methylase subunit